MLAEKFNIKCKYCGKTGFKWKWIKYKVFRLIDRNGEIHSCKGIKSENNFSFTIKFEEEQ